jgi:hypothetical protein
VGWRVYLPTYMSSRGEMKMSLKLMTCYLFSETAHWIKKAVQARTFSWRRCLRSFNSRYVRLDRTGVLKGFMIFLIATGDAVS